MSRRITTESTDLAARLMRWTGISTDRGGLSCMPQIDAKIGWGIKRFAPTTFTRSAGLVSRIGSAVSS